jgi:hypothetical protein
VVKILGSNHTGVKSQFPPVPGNAGKRVFSWTPPKKMGISPLGKKGGGGNGYTLLLIDFYIIERLYIPVTIVNSDHAVEASMVN